jgi:hypothetical protein
LAREIPLTFGMGHTAVMDGVYFDGVMIMVLI